MTGGFTGAGGRLTVIVIPFDFALPGETSLSVPLIASDGTLTRILVERTSLPITDRVQWRLPSRAGNRIRVRASRPWAPTSSSPVRTTTTGEPAWQGSAVRMQRTHTSVGRTTLALAAGTTSAQSAPAQATAASNAAILLGCRAGLM